MPFVLPVVKKRKLQQKLFSELDVLIDGADFRLFDQTYWGNAFVEGMAPFFTKPRDVIRYINAVAVTFPALRNEVNITDFFALEALRIFFFLSYTTPFAITSVTLLGLLQMGSIRVREQRRDCSIGMDGKNPRSRKGRCSFNVGTDFS